MNKRTFLSSVSISLLASPYAELLAAESPEIDLTFEGWAEFVTSGSGFGSLLAMLMRDPDKLSSVQKGDISMNYNVLDSSAHIPGMLGYWIQSGWNLELDWWELSTARKSTNYARITAFAFILCTESDDRERKEDCFRRYAGRFKTDERVQRLREIDLCSESVKKFAKVFYAQLCRNTSQMEHIKRATDILAKLQNL